VALKYEREKDGAPKVLAKGRGILAEKIVELAKKHNPPLLSLPSIIGRRDAYFTTRFLLLLQERSQL